jgi:large subunit ribosomal protein L31
MRHPETHIVDLDCANCGQTHRLRSTAASISVEICSNCHPAYTGVSRTTVAGDRVERFNRRLAGAAR